MNTVPARSACHVIDLASKSVDARELCAAAGLDPAILDDRDARISMNDLVQLYEIAAEVTGDRCFGLHVGEQVDPRAYGTFGFLVLNSPTIGEAIKNAARYLPLYTHGASFELAEDARTLAVNWHYADASLQELSHDSEMTLATVAAVTRRLTGERCVGEVHLRRPPPRDPSEHERLLGARVHFRMRSNQLIFGRGALDTKIRGADPELRGLLEHQAAIALHRPACDWVDATKELLRKTLGTGTVRLQTIARRLGTSARTLQRQLGARGTSFAIELATVRRELAEQNLISGDPTLTISEIAARLGYAHASEFHRAFRGWTGIAPQQFRARSLQRSRSDRGGR